MQKSSLFILISLFLISSVFAQEISEGFYQMKRYVIEDYREQDWDEANNRVKEYIRAYKDALSQHELQAVYLLYAETFFLKKEYKEAAGILKEAIEQYDSALETRLEENYREYSKYINKPLLDINPWPEDRESCEAFDGIWHKNGSFIKQDVSVSGYCNLPTEDGGKRCSDWSHCQGSCVVVSDIPRGVEMDGTCSDWVLGETRCSNIVSDGIVAGNVCS